jgi:hypothetical protein
LKRALALSLSLALSATLAACRGSSTSTTDVTARPEAKGHSGDCAGCHLGEFNAVTHPMHPGKKPTTCAVCHRENTWGSTHLDHKWPLEGAHRKADCFLCHQGAPPMFEGTSDVCDDCHRPEFDKENARNPAHVKFGIQCQDCHTPVAWKPAHDRLASPATSATTAPTAPTAPVATTTTKPKTPVTKPVVTPTPKPVPTPTVVTPPPSPKTVPRPQITTGASSRR